MMNKNLSDFFLFITFTPNNVFFVLTKLKVIIHDQTVGLNSGVSETLISLSCGIYKEKGIKRSNILAFESNFKFFMQKIRLKKINFSKLVIVYNPSLYKLRRNKFIFRNFLKKYTQIIMKYLAIENIQANFFNNQKYQFNGCKLSKFQRKKIRRKNLNWLILG